MNDERDKLDVALVEAVSLAQRIPDLPQGPGTPEDDDALLRYLDSDVDLEERETLRQQVHQSAGGRASLAILREALTEAEAEEPSPDASPNQIRLAFTWARDGLRYLWGSLEPRSLVAVPVATRGSVPDGLREETAFFDFAHRFGEVEVVIQVERVRDDRLDLQLSFGGQGSGTAPLRVNLADQAGGLLDSQPVEHGTARFAGLSPEAHSLTISSARTEVGRVLLDIHSA